VDPALRAWGIALGALVVGCAPHSSGPQQVDPALKPIESRIQVGKASLYVRTIGQGQPMIVLHGGPDFDTGYLLPALDRLADAFRLVYYDQRGRGRSAENVQPDDVTLASDIEDLDRVRQDLHLDAPAILGHSWGAILALEYALRHPASVSRLILMNPGPASASDLAIMRGAYVAALGKNDVDRQREMLESVAYRDGDPEAVVARYRIHFEHALRRPEDYETLMEIMTEGFVRQGPEGILKARAVEDRLMRDTWHLPGYDLISRLRGLSMPTLVITGDHDFIPVEIAEHIAQTIPRAKLVVIEDCGHFAYLERAVEVRSAVDDFFRATAER
jgi:proline iminopeptidase